MEDIKQPTGREVGMPRLATPKYFGGSSRSVKRLESLDFDPIQKLVLQYDEIEAEIAYQKKLKSGEIVELSASTGKARAYRPEIHHALYDKLTAIADKLVRYKYGRVPEVNINEERRPQSLVVNLTRKGETYVLNNGEGVEDI